MKKSVYWILSTNLDIVLRRYAAGSQYDSRVTVLNAALENFEFLKESVDCRLLLCRINLESCYFIGLSNLALVIVLGDVDS